MSEMPRAIAVVLSITALVTSLQWIVPGLPQLMQRSPAALTTGEWRRMITAMFINRTDSSELILNLAADGLAGALQSAGVAESPHRSHTSLDVHERARHVMSIIEQPATIGLVTILIDQRPDGVHISYDSMASLLAPYGYRNALESRRIST